MALADLIITDEQISEELIEKVLKDRVNLVKAGNKVILTRKNINSANRIKVLLFLAGGKAWELIEKTEFSFTPADMEKAISIPGNSLRPVLKELSDDFLLSNEKGRYQITSRGIYELETILEDLTEESSKTTKKKSGTKHSSNKSKSSNVPPKADAFEGLITDGFFSLPKSNKEIIEELSCRGVTIKPTSLPVYLLPLVRKKKLSRERVVRNKGKIWVYKK